MKKGWGKRWRAGFDRDELPAWKKHASARELAEYCIEHHVHPIKVGITDPDKYNRIVACYDSMIAVSHHDGAPHEKRAPYQSASNNQIKNRTGGRNRKERRGS